MRIRNILILVSTLSLFAFNGSVAYAQENNSDKCYERLDGQFCGLFDNPFEAISNAFLKEWIGDWYLVLIFVPFPISAIIITKNFTYGGFLGIIMTGTLETIYPTAFEIALTLISISVGLVFVETIYKRIFD